MQNYYGVVYNNACNVMLKITILAVGKIKEKNYAELMAEYLKRLSVDAVVEMVEMKSEPFRSQSDYEKVKKAEGRRIIDFLEKRPASKIFILDERGKEFTSEEFAGLLEREQQAEIVFVIGGSLGLSDEILNYPKAQKMALSKMTFLHEMIRVILLEQIYRAVAIMKNKRYHY